MDKTTATRGEYPPVNFPIYEIVDSSDGATSNHQPSLNSRSEPLLRQSKRNVGPPKIYDKLYFIDVIDQLEETSGSASSDYPG